MGAVFGKKITLTIFGESHGTAIGCVLANLPSGVELDLEKIQNELQRRAPGNSPLATSRKEADEFEIVSGLFQGKTTGSPLCMLIKNSSQRSGDYELLKDLVRPGHADYVAKIKYKQALNSTAYKQLPAYLANSALIASTIRGSLAVMSGAKRATTSPFLLIKNFSKFHSTSGGSFGVKP